MQLRAKHLGRIAFFAIALPAFAFAQFAPSVSGQWQTQGRSPTGFATQAAEFSDPALIDLSSRVFSDDSGLVFSQSQLFATQGNLGVKAYAHFAAPAVPTAANVGMASQSSFADALQVVSSTLPVGTPAVIRVGINFAAIVTNDDTTSSQGFADGRFNLKAFFAIDAPLFSPSFTTTGPGRTFAGSSHVLAWTTVDYPITVGDVLTVQGDLLADVFVGGADVDLTSTAGVSSNIAIAAMTPGVSLQSVSGTAYPVLSTTGLSGQAISFGPPPAIAVGATASLVVAGGDSGNPVLLSSLTPSVCSVSGNVVSGYAEGTCRIAADQFGDATYAPAPRVILDLRIGSTSCSPGNFSTTGNAPCTPCPLGSFTSATGSSSCTLAPPGSYVGALGSASATLCPPGLFSNASGATSCTPAPAGSYVAGAGGTFAPLCVAGTFSGSPGATACTLAPIGTFVAGAGATFATPCPVGTFSNNVGAASCRLAPAGYYVDVIGAAQAIACRAGSFSAGEGATSCTLAPPGSYVDATASTSARLCLRGTYSDQPGASACLVATPGHYVPVDGATSQTPCSPGTFSSAAGATSCTPAPAGTYAASAGSTAPVACPAGTWSDPGATSCTPLATMLSQTITAALGTAGLAASFQQQVSDIVSAPNASARAGKLQAFVNHVEAQRGKALTDAQANRLIMLARML